ncbi:MAG TPA: hypothetical protein VKI19_13760 [Acidimicrobiales bacterium]|nr:hypothetical protein [Acidimicrobiales bacterium]
MTDKKHADLNQLEKHRMLSRPRSQSAPPSLSNGARSRLAENGGLAELPFEAGNKAVTSVIEKVNTDLEDLLKSAQDRTDALFGIGPLAPGHRPPEEETGGRSPGRAKGRTSPPPKSKSTSTRASGWKQLKRRAGELFGTKKSKESAVRREIALSEKYGIRIGPGDIDGDVHMTHSMLDRIEKILDQLPVSHISGNSSLIGLSGNQGEGAASTYDFDTKVIGINRPFNMPGWLYSILSPYWKIQRSQMEKGAMGDYAGITKEEDKELGLEGRSVFAGVNDVLAQENLLQNTVRHEIGHSIDDKIGWDDHESGKDMFGSWQKHYGQTGAEEVAKAFLTRAGLEEEMEDPIPPNKNGKPLYWWFAKRIPGNDGPDVRINRPSADLIKELEKTAPIVTWMNGAPGRKQKLLAAIESARVALAQAWTLSDGGGDRVTVDGRMYHMDHYQTWVSYDADARTHALSNYQFSTSSEWFAEAYTAFYNPEDPTPRSQLTAEVREWFEQQLGPPLARGEEGRNEGEGELSDGGRLGRLG